MRLHKILIVDDRAEVREAISLPLEYAGYQTLEAFSGEEAFRILKIDSCIDAVFLDIHLPYMDGIETLQKIKQSYPHIEICILSADNSDSIIDNSYKFGAYAYLEKPGNVSEILRIAKEMKQVAAFKAKITMCQIGG